MFRLEYFHRPAVLQQSPQFYKQMMVGVFDRVFETAPVFRAEKHNSKRHLNEYTSLDFEMGYIDGFEDIMAMETGFLQYTMKLLERDYAKELKMLRRGFRMWSRSRRFALMRRNRKWRKNITARSEILTILSRKKKR